MIQNISPQQSITAGINFLDPNPAGKNPVLFLHGLGADCESWPWQIKALAEAGYRPLALDLPGFGKSPKYPGRWTITKTAAAVWNFALQLELEHFNLAGISMGGTVALKIALDHPDNLDRLVLINTFARLRPKSPGQAVYFLRRFLMVSTGDRTKQAEFVAERIFPDKGQQELRNFLEGKILQADQHVYRQAMVSLGLFRVMNHLAAIRVPALVISGEKDTTVALENQIELAGAIHTARHVIIPGGGHAVTVDHPEDVNAAILAFLVE
ncbi:MAG: alpha/beta fold hydrolase [Anaerolineaceae bacterium]